MTHAPPQYLIFTPPPQLFLIILLTPFNVLWQTNSVLWSKLSKVIFMYYLLYNIKLNFFFNDSSSWC